MSENRVLVGKITSNKMDKSIIVSVLRRVSHRKYGKIIKRTSKIHAHDEKNECHVGDTVRIVETRPISKMKAWKLVEILERAQ